MLIDTLGASLSRESSIYSMHYVIDILDLIRIIDILDDINFRLHSRSLKLKSMNMLAQLQWLIKITTDN